MYSASSTSLVVSAGVSISRSGTLTPWRAFILPPTITSALTSESETRSVTFNFRRPSSIINSIPTVRPLSKAICSRVSVIVILPGLIKSVASFISANSTISPFVHITGSGTPSAISPTLNFGPCKSPSTSTCFPSAFAVARSRGYSSSNTPPLRWEQLSRKTFTPASIIFGSISSVQEAGPRVATILVVRFESSCCIRQSFPWNMTLLSETPECSYTFLPLTIFLIRPSTHHPSPFTHCMYSLKLILPFSSVSQLAMKPFSSLSVGSRPSPLFSNDHRPFTSVLSSAPVPSLSHLS